ncbi:Dbl homology domain-containing protein [Sporodiniella umbellata]|nr:Dbl homology domain-containing protein [Sporodiniella umbellata]
MAELLTTEETYLSHLMTIKKFYMDPLFNATIQKGSLITSKDIETIFAHIPQLISLSSSLAERLHQVIIMPFEEERPADGFVPIGKIFCDFENYFSVYIAYAVNFSRSRKCLAKASSSIVYRQLVQSSVRKKDPSKMILDDYMIEPIQRITRYSLLLKDLQKHTDPNNPDFTYLDKAIKSLSALAVAMDYVQ